jgi:hypothetical protein
VRSFLQKAVMWAETGKEALFAELQVTVSNFLVDKVRSQTKS